MCDGKEIARRYLGIRVMRVPCRADDLGGRGDLLIRRFCQLLCSEEEVGSHQVEHHFRFVRIVQGSIVAADHTKVIVERKERAEK